MDCPPSPALPAAGRFGCGAPFAFFDTPDGGRERMIQSHFDGGRACLSQSSEWLLSAEDEQAECERFLRWAHEGAESGRVRKVVEAVPAHALCLLAQSDQTHGTDVATGSVVELQSLPSYKVEIIDFSLVGRVDDFIYSKSESIWFLLPRGCAMIRVSIAPLADSGRSEGSVILRWLVRANRKFTGQEDDDDDDGGVDASDESSAGATPPSSSPSSSPPARPSLYTLTAAHHFGQSIRPLLEPCSEPAISAPAAPAPLTPTETIVTMKMNGQVFHLSGRSITFTDRVVLHRRVTLNLICLGSKKVHLVVSYLPAALLAAHSDVADTTTRIAAYPSSRHALIHEMWTALRPFLTPSMFDFLTKYRLTMNFEYVCPTSSGPIDNQRLLALTQPTLFFFSSTINQLFLPLSCCLCVDPVYMLETVSQLFGLAIVPYRCITAEQFSHSSASCAPSPSSSTSSPSSSTSGMSDVRAQIHALPSCEGSVLYHYCDSVSVSSGCPVGAVVQLEKCKSSEYVVVRALREKSKRFVFGTAKKPGIERSLKQLMEELACKSRESSIASAALISKLASKHKQSGKNKRKSDASDWQAPSLSEHVTMFTLPSACFINDLIVEQGGVFIDSDSFYFDSLSSPSANSPSPIPSLASFQHAFVSKRIASSFSSLLQQSVEHVVARIRSIHHVPITDEQRQQWYVRCAAFMFFLHQRVVNYYYPPARVDYFDLPSLAPPVEAHSASFPVPSATLVSSLLFDAFSSTYSTFHSQFFHHLKPDVLAQIHLLVAKFSST